MQAIHCNGLTKTYGRRRVLDGLDLKVPAGEVVSLLGPNGAGKTTAFRIILGLTRPESGAVSIDGVDALRHRIAANHRIGYVPEIVPVDGERTAYENLLDAGRLHGLAARVLAERIPRLLQQVGLEDRMHDRVRAFSKGMRQRLGIARALVHRPPFLLLDEPSSGLDPTGQAHVRRIIAHLADHGIGILLATHNLHEAQRVSDAVTVLVGGKRRTALSLRTGPTVDLEAIYREHAEAAVVA